MIVAVLAAIAEPTRLVAMHLLADGSEHCVCELMRKLSATQSRMLRHMEVLKQAGLVMDCQSARKVDPLSASKIDPPVRRDQGLSRRNGQGV
jgi:ArsR family transcriptional regulator